MSHQKLAVLAVSLVVSLGLAIPAFAGSKIFDTKDTLSTTFKGAVETTVAGDADPFVVQVWASSNECFRFSVSVQAADLEATLVSPSGRVWQDDDSNGSNRPLIKAITDKVGWYILIVSHYAGNPTNANFTAAFGRFPSTSTQCANPTLSQMEATEEDDAPKSEGDGVSPRLPEGPHQP